ncbi:MAG: CRISPR-associated protein Cas4, partial [bacterium]
IVMHKRLTKGTTERAAFLSGPSVVSSSFQKLIEHGCSFISITIQSIMVSAMISGITLTPLTVPYFRIWRPISSGRRCWSGLKGVKALSSFITQNPILRILEIMSSNFSRENNPDRVWNPVRVDNPITGVMVNYHLVCHTKLWYFAHDIQMEQESDLVALGKLTHEEHYTRDSKEMLMLGSIRIDRITPDGYIHEVKKSDIAERAHIWQLKYYLWVLKENGFGQLNGILEFPKQRKRVEVTLSSADENQISKKMEEITKVVNQPNPPKAKKIPFCRRCSYRELCWC